MDDQTITIPFPRPSQNVNRGYVRVHGEIPATRPTTIRFNDDDRVTIDKVAHQLGMTFGEFTRWCALYGATAVNNELARRSFEEKKTGKVIDTSGYT